LADTNQRRVLIALLVFTVGAVAVVWLRPAWIVPKISLVKDGDLAYDFNDDGRVDLIERWENGVLRETQQDTDGDGAFDAFTHFRDGDAVRLEYDLDKDGKLDYRAVVDSEGREYVEVLRDGEFVPVNRDKSTPPSVPSAIE
jgi:Family of unknown function (DUF6802)